MPRSRHRKNSRKFTGRIPLSPKAARKIRELAKQGFDVRGISQNTGFNGQDIQAVLNCNKSTVCVGGALRVRKSQLSANTKPEWVHEVENNTGLNAIFSKKLLKYTGSEEWLLMSPTNVCILIMWGKGHLIQGAHAPKRFSVQGITKAERDARVAKIRAMASPPIPSTFDMDSFKDNREC